MFQIERKFAYSSKNEKKTKACALIFTVDVKNWSQYDDLLFRIQFHQSEIFLFMRSKKAKNHLWGYSEWFT